MLTTIALSVAGCNGDLISPGTDPYRDIEWNLVGVETLHAPGGIVQGLYLGRYEAKDPEAAAVRDCSLSMDLMFVGEWGWVEDGHRIHRGFMHELRPDSPYVSFYMDFRTECRTGSEKGRLVLLLDAIVEPDFQVAEGADSMRLGYGGFVEPGQTEALNLPAPSVSAAEWVDLSFPAAVALDTTLSIPLGVTFTHWSRAADGVEAQPLATVTRTLQLHFRRSAVWRDRKAP